jgi:hypothetical protein
MLTLQEVLGIYEEEYGQFPPVCAPLRTRIRAAESLLSNEALADLPEEVRRHARANDRMLTYASYWRRPDLATYRTDAIMADLIIEHFRDWTETAAYIRDEISLPIPGTAFRGWTTEGVARLHTSVVSILFQLEEERNARGYIIARSDWFEDMFMSALAFYRILLGECRADAILVELQGIIGLIQQCKDIHRAARRATEENLPFA